MAEHVASRADRDGNHERTDRWRTAIGRRERGTSRPKASGKSDGKARVHVTHQRAEHELAEDSTSGEPKTTHSAAGAAALRITRR